MRLDLLRQDIHNGVPELPELGELPPQRAYPLRWIVQPFRHDRRVLWHLMHFRPQRNRYDRGAVGSIAGEDSYPNELPGLPEQDGALTTSVDAPVASPASEADLPPMTRSQARSTYRYVPFEGPRWTLTI